VLTTATSSVLSELALRGILNFTGLTLSQIQNKAVFEMLVDDAGWCFMSAVI